MLRGVNRDIAKLQERDASVGETALAETARALARELGDPDNSATSKALCARALTETMEALAASLPPAKTTDAIDDLSARRDERRGGSAVA